MTLTFESLRVVTEMLNAWRKMREFFDSQGGCGCFLDLDSPAECERVGNYVIKNIFLNIFQREDNLDIRLICS